VCLNASTLSWVNTSIEVTSTGNVDPTANTVSGGLTIIGAAAPAAGYDGLIWQDTVNQRSATYVKDASYSFWKWASWGIGEAYVDDALGDTVASTGFFDKVNEAVAALDAEMAAEEPITVVLAQGKLQTLTGSTITLPDRPVTIRGGSGVHLNDDTFNTTLTGNIVLTAADGAGNRMVLILRDLVYNGDITGASNWEIQLQDCHLDSDAKIARTHGTNGCRVKCVGLYSEGGKFSVVDADAASGQSNAAISIKNSVLFIEDSPPAFDFAGPAVLTLTDCQVNGAILSSGSMIDAASDSFQANFENVRFEMYLFAGITFSMISNGGSDTVKYRTAVFMDSTPGGGRFDLSATTLHGQATIIGTPEPVNPFAGLRWDDQELHESLVYNGNNWISGG